MQEGKYMSPLSDFSESHVTVDLEANAAYLYLLDADIVRTEFVSDVVNVDIDDHGSVVGVELLDLEAELPYDLLREGFNLTSEDLSPLEEALAS
jgi:uncharacterized protein YuzE